MRIERTLPSIFLAVIFNVPFDTSASLSLPYLPDT